MGGFIIVQDGRAYAQSNWAYDQTVNAIARALEGSPSGEELARWLRQQTCEVCGPGLGSVDLRELTASAQTEFATAARTAFATAEKEGSASFAQPSFFSQWLDGVGVLLRLLASVEKGEDPSTYNPHMRDLIPPTGQRAGPGWDDDEGGA